MRLARALRSHTFAAPEPSHPAVVDALVELRDAVMAYATRVQGEIAGFKYDETAGTLAEKKLHAAKVADLVDYRKDKRLDEECRPEHSPAIVAALWHCYRVSRRFLRVPGHDLAGQVDGLLEALATCVDVARAEGRWAA